MVEAITVYQCALCHRATYTTTEVAHDWFHVGEVLDYAEQVVCSLCEIEARIRAERRKREEHERERACGMLLGVPESPVLGSAQHLVALDVRTAEERECSRLHACYLRFLCQTQKEAER